MLEKERILQYKFASDDPSVIFGTSSDLFAQRINVLVIWEPPWHPIRYSPFYGNAAPSFALKGWSTLLNSLLTTSPKFSNAWKARLFRQILMERCYRHQIDYFRKKWLWRTLPIPLWWKHLSAFGKSCVSQSRQEARLVFGVLSSRRLDEAKVSNLF